MNWGGTARGTIPACDWRKITKTLVRIAVIVTDIQSGKNPNAIENGYQRQPAKLIFESALLMEVRSSVVG
jgi:hypothetical protein